jgi:hypothetical protein
MMCASLAIFAKYVIPPLVTFGLGLFAGWCLQRRSQRHALLRKIVERYTALPEPRPGASAGLERLALLQRCGAGELTRRELGQAADAIRGFGRHDPLDTGTGIAAFDLLQQASSVGHEFGSATETYQWIVSINVARKAGWFVNLLRTFIVGIGLGAFPSTMLFSSIRRRELWAVFLGVGIAACVVAAFWNDELGFWIYALTLAISIAYFFTHRGLARSDSTFISTIIRERFHYIVISIAIIVAALIYASLNRYYFVHDSSTQRTRVYDRFTGRPVPWYKII